MPVAKQYAYYDHAAVAPLSLPARTAIERWAAECCEQGDRHWPQWEQLAQQTRRTAAELINADPAEVALVPNTTAGLSIVAEGYPWEEGQNVVSLANEFPSNAYPWMNLAAKGVQNRRVEVQDGRVDLDQILEACDEQTKIVAISWVGYASGWRLTNEELTQLTAAVHQRGALLVLDAIQGLGVFPLDVQATGVDFVAADGHKWMLGPEGAGLFYLRKEHLSLLRPHGVGWNSVKQPYNFGRINLDLRETAERFEGGTRNMSGAIGLGASLKLLQSLGLSPRVSPIADQVLTLGEIASERLKAAGAEILNPRDGLHNTGIVCFRWPGEEPGAVRDRCLEQNVVLSCRGAGLRISPHGYNNADDLDQLIAALTSTP